jgi:glycosyltransferase involved in cell wall biosynthesis
MRVLQIIICQNLFDNSNSVTGPEKRMKNMLPYWKNHNIDVVVAYPEHGKFTTYFRSLTEVYSYQIRPFYDLRNCVEICRIITKAKCDIVHIQGPAILDFWATIISKVLKKKIVITRPIILEDQVHYSFLRKLVYSWIDRNITLRYADNVIAVSKDGVRRLKELVGKKTELNLIYNGVDFDKIYIKSSYDISSDVVRLCMVAGLYVQKGWFDFLVVVKNLTDLGYSVSADIIGDGEIKGQLKIATQELGISCNVNFLGYRSDIAKILCNYDIYLFTSHREGLSVSILEAMAAGLPIVATNVGGTREQLESRSGLIAEAKDIVNLTSLVKELIDNPMLRKELGHNALHRAKLYFSESNMVNQHAIVFKGLQA